MKLKGIAKHLLISVKGIVSGLIVGAGGFVISNIFPDKKIILALYMLFGIWAWGFLGDKLWGWK